MATSGNGVLEMSSLKGVTVLVVALTFLLMALLWTLPGDNIPDDRRRHVHHVTMNKNKVKRSVEGRPVCQMLSPSDNDKDVLRFVTKDDSVGMENGAAIPHKAHTHVVTCVMETDCTFESILYVNCVAVDCTHFVVNMEGSKHVIRDVSLGALEAIIRLRGSSAAPVNVVCDKGDVYSTRDVKWQSLEVHRRRVKDCKKSYSENWIPQNIHVISVRYISRWEVLARMTKLTELVTTDALQGVRVLDFSKYQSTEWKDIDNLYALLQGKPSPNDTVDTLMDTAKRNGFDIGIFDLSEEDYHRSLNLRRVLRNQATECSYRGTNHASRFDSVSACNCSHYQGTELSTEEKLAKLATCLAGVNVNPALSSRRVLTMTFLENTDWDYSLDNTVDATLARIVSTITSTGNSVVVLLSDVGNPSFSRLEHSLFIQTQASNPFCFIFYHMPSEKESKLLTLDRNRDKLISLRDIHITISDFLSWETRIDSANKHSEFPNQYAGLSLLRSIIPDRSAAELNVNPPNVALCDSMPIAYPNDTIQAAYAEAIIGFINNYIQKRQKITTGIRNNSLKCRGVVGLRFFNVRKSHKGDASLTVMDLHVRGITSKVVQLLKDVIVTVRHSTPGNHSLSVESKWGSFETILDRQLLPAVCSDAMDVTLLLIPPARVPLLLVGVRSFGSKPKLLRLHGDCLFLIIHGFTDSESYYVTNACDDRKYDVVFTGDLRSVFSLAPLPIKLSVPAASVSFVTSFVKTSYTVGVTSFHYETYYDMTIISG